MAHRLKVISDEDAEKFRNLVFLIRVCEQSENYDEMTE